LKPIVPLPLIFPFKVLKEPQMLTPKLQSLVFTRELHTMSAIKSLVLQRAVRCIRDYATGPRYRIIPGHRAMMALYDAIQSRALTWATNGIDYFFSDDIHLNEIGNYDIACLHFAVVYRASPVGTTVPAQLQGSLSAAQALQLQEMAWRAASSYPQSGISD
jgi:hypothetical protein